MIDRLRPVRAGWRSMRDPFQWIEYDLTWNEGARRFESGTLNVYGIAALGGSLEILLEVGAGEIETRVLALTDLAARGLADLGMAVVSSRRRGETSSIVTAVPAGRTRSQAVRPAGTWCGSWASGTSSSPPAPAACGSPPTSTTRPRRSSGVWRRWEPCCRGGPAWPPWVGKIADRGPTPAQGGHIGPPLQNLPRSISLFSPEGRVEGWEKRAGVMRGYLPPVRTGGAGRFGKAFGCSASCFITSATPRSSCGSRPSRTDLTSFSTTMSGSTPCPSMIHCPSRETEPASGTKIWPPSIIGP
ncbi:MAG: hypothetical protein DMF53_01560 [Acidobacteria bacterium]|nr:MAG: hypothetical protein DMF53_01560 [Acidobacteriota bacterium]